jgi:GNAT superfamily N-acetyltransferase
MQYRIRHARSTDKPSVAAFTEDTFAWGDYVTGAFDRWLADPQGVLVVATDENDEAIAIARGTLLSATELWLQGARVHTDWRRFGIASALDAELENWGRAQGAQVARLAIEEWNAPAQAQVQKIGMRPSGEWLTGDRDVHGPQIVPSGNGGRRRPPQDRLVAAPSAEAAPAFMAWSAGELGRAARGLFVLGWNWRRLTLDDLVRGARGAALWMSPAGWALAALDDGELEVGWAETGPDDADELVRAVLDLADELNADTVTVKLPALDWVRQALDVAGFRTSSLTLYAKPL